MPDVQNEMGLAEVIEDGDATQVNTDTVGAQRGVSAVRLADGKYVVGWSTEDQNVGGPADNKFRMFDADGSPFGPEMAMPDSGGNLFGAGHIAALGGGGFVAVWSESVEGVQHRYTSHAQRFDSDGVAVGSPVLVGPDNGEPRYIERVVSTGDGYVILEDQTGFNDAGLFASFVSADGTVLSRQKLGETDANFHRFPRADLLEDGSVLIAYMTAEEHEFPDAVAYQRFAADGTTLAGEAFIGNTGSELGYYPDVTALEGGGAIIVWRDRADSLNIKVQKIGADGAETGPRITIESFYGEDYSSQGQVQVEALPDGGFIAAWHASRRSASNSDPTIYDTFVAHFDADGAQVGETQMLDGLEEGERLFHDILVKEDGTVLLYWGDPPYAHDVERRGVIQREFSLDLDSGDAAQDDADAIEFEPPTLKLLEGAVAQLRFQAVAQDGGELTYSLIQQATSGAAVVNADGSFTYTPNVRFTGQDSFRVLVQDASGNSLEQDIPIAVFDADEVEANWEPFSHSVNGQYFSIEDFAYLGLDNGNLLVATSDYGDGVTTRIFGIDGQPIGDLNVLPPWDFDIEHSSIEEVRLYRTPSGGAVLNWAVNSYDGENLLGYFHYVQEVDENGLTDAAPIALRMDHDTSHIEESISAFGFKDSFAVLSDGSYVAAWSDRNADTGMDVALQIFESDGTARTGRVAVTNEDWFEMFPVVVALEDSDFAVTWQKDGARTRIYGSDGLPVTDQITLTDDEGVGSIDVCALGDGGYLAFWKVGNSNDGYQILGRRVASDGTLVGGPITLLGDAEGVTSFDAIRLPEGGFGFRWATDVTHSDTGDEFKVNFMQRFDSNAAAIEEPFLLTVSLSGQYLFTDLTPTADGGFVVGWGPMFRYFEAQSGFGTGEADVLVGNSRSNLMDAGGGDDTVFGGDGADTLLGQAGNDTLDGGDGDDTLIGAAGDDVLIGGAGTDTVRFSGDFDSYSFVSVSGTLTVTDSESGRDGTTTLSGAEVLEFSDRTVVLGDEVQWAATEEAVVENSGPQSVGTVSTNALSSESFELSLADDVDGLFVLDPATGVISATAPFDYEAQSAYSLTVQAAGDSGSSFTKSFVVSVGDQNEAPVLADGALSIWENATIGTAFGTLSATDPDGGDRLTYSLVDDAGGLFSIDAASGVISVAGTLDYETAAQHGVVVRATDQGGLSSTATMTVDIEDQGEAPVLADGTFSVAENATIGTAFGTLSATDPDGGDSLTYSLVDDARGLFSIDAASGVLSLVGELDFETTDQHQLVVSATDAAGLSDVKTISVDVADVQEPEMLSLFLEQGTQVDSSLRLDDPGNISSIVVLKGEENGVLTLNSDGGFRYVPNADFVGTDSIIVETTDTDGVSSQIELQFEIREKGSIRTTSSDREDVDNPKAGNVYYTKSVALADGKYMVLWTRTENGGAFRGQVYDSNDEPVGEQSVLADFTPRSEESGIARFSVNPDSRGGAILSWVTRTDFGWRIYAQRVGSDGQAISEPLILDEVHSGNWMLDLAGVVETSDGEFSAFWGNFVGSKPGPSNWRQVVSRKISADFELVGERTVVADGRGNSDNLVGQLVALDEGRVAVVWTEIDRESEYLLNNQVLIQFLDREGVPEPNGPFVLDGPNIGHPVHLEKLADGSIAALWTQKMGDPSRPENPIRSSVVLSHISDRGELISGPNLVRELTGGDLKIHSTSLMLMPDGNLAVNWVEGEWNQPENFREFIQRFDPDGTPVGALIDLDALTGGETVFADYSVLSDGRILAASSQFDSERTYYDYAKRRILSLAANLGTSHDDHIFLGDLGDDVGGSTGNDIVVGGAGNDTIFGGSGADTLLGGDGDDFIVGGSGNDTLTGGGGDDFIVSDAGEDVLDGGDGNDTFVLNVDDVTNVQAIGGAGRDTVRLVGLDGASAIHAESGTISIDGTIAVHGEGLDKVEFVFDGMDALNTASPTVHDAGSAVQFDGADPGYFENIIGGLSGMELSVTANADLIVDLSDGYSREALTAVKEALGAVVTYGADSTLQFWNVMNDAVDIDAVLAEFSFAHHVDLNAELTFEMNAPEVVHTESVAAELLAQAEGDFSADAVTPNDPSYGSLYGLRYISAPDAWEIRSDASSVVIGVIDTGIDVDHPDLVNNLWVNEGEIWGDGIDNDGNGYIDDYNGYDFFNDRGIGPGSNSDGHGHGTHVAGTIAAEGNNGIGVSGVAWNASLMAVKIFSDAGTTNTAAIIAGIQYATMMGAQVTNNSWGGGAYNTSILSAIEAAQAADSIFVAAAGNDDGVNNDVSPHYPSSYNLDNIVAVASTDSFDRLSSFSNYGATTVDLGAPGTGIYSTYKNSTYATLNGTSMATPHVTGAIALMKAENPSLSYSEIIDALLNSVDSISSMTGTTASGGRLNLEAALLAVQDGEGPIVTAHNIFLAEGVGSFRHAINIINPTGVSVSVQTAPAIGSLSLVEDEPGTFDYTPGAGNYGERVDLRVTNAEGSSSVATFFINQMAAGSTTITGADSADLIIGGSADELLSGGGGNDIIRGGDGDDTLIGGAGADTLDGGAGVDTADYSSFATGVTVALDGSPSSTGDTIVNVENLIGSNQADKLTGNDDANVLVGGQGNDTLIGGAGADTLIGLDGTDYASYETTAEGLTISMPHGIGTGDAEGDLYLNMEGIIGGQGNDRILNWSGTISLFGEDGDDILIGSSGHQFDTLSDTDFLSGDDGNDTLIGQDGDDTIYGGDGDDLIFAGRGSDTVFGGAGSDTLHLGYLAGSVDIDMANGIATGAEFGTVTFTGIESIVYVDAASGSVSATEDTEIFVDTYATVIDYSASGEAITIDLRTASGSGGLAEGDILVGDISLRGTDFDDTFYLSKGDQTVAGGGGMDTVVLTGNYSEYDISEASGTVTFSDHTAGRDGTNVLSGVEFVEFADRTLMLGSALNWEIASQSVDENEASAQQAASVSVVTFGDESFSLSLADDFDGRFSFNSVTGQISTTRALNYEDQASYTLTVVATGDQGGSDSREIVVAVADLNDAPVVEVSSFDFDKTVTVGSAVGTVQASDEDVGDVLTFSLVDDAGGRFAIDASTGVISVATNLEFEDPASHDLIVRVEDDEGLSATTTVTATSNDANRAPELWRGDARMVAGAELSADLISVDPEGEAISYELLSDVSNGTLQLSTDGAYSYVADAGFTGTDTFSVRISYEGGASRDVDVSVEVVAEDQVAPGVSGLRAAAESIDLFGESEEVISYPRVAALSSGGYVVSNEFYILDDPSYRSHTFRIYDSNDEQVGEPISLGDNINGNGTRDPIAGTLDGGFLAYYERVNEDGSTDFVVKRFDAGGVPIETSVIVENTSSTDHPDTIETRSDGAYYVTWRTDNPSGAAGADAVYGRQVASNGAMGPTTRLDVSATDLRRTFGTDELADGRLLAHWLEYDADARTYSIQGRYLDANGTLDSAPFTIESGYSIRGLAYHRLVALDGGGFALAWTAGGEASGGNAWDIYARIFDSDAQPVTDSFIIHEDVEGSEGTPYLAATPNGGFVASWYVLNSDEVRARAFASDGTALGAEQLVSDGDIGRLAGQNGVTALTDGSILVHWKLTNLDDYRGHHHHRRYTLSDGGLQGDESNNILALSDTDGVVFGHGGSDLLFGGAGDDTLIGGEGDDTLVGGDGADVAVFTGNLQDYDVTVSDGTVYVTDRTESRDGTDTLTGIDGLVFSDLSISVSDGFVWTTDLAPIDENEAASQTVGTVAYHAITGETFTFSLADDIGGRFTIDPSSGAIASNGSFDFESQSQYALTVQASGNLGTSDEHTVTVSVRDLNEVPETADVSVTVAEHSAFGTVIGTAPASDPDAGDILTFSLIDDADGLFAIDSETGEIRVAGDIDYEIASEHVLTYQATDTLGQASTGTVTVSVTDVNEAPEIVDLHLRMSSDSGPADWVLSGHDAEGEPLTYAMHSEASSGTATVNPDGSVRYVPNADFVGDDWFQVSVSDPSGGTRTVTIEVSVLDGSETAFGEIGSAQEVSGTTDASIHANILSRTDDNKIVSFWVDGASETVFSRAVDGDGNPSGPVVTVNTSSDGKSQFHVSHLIGGGALLTWVSLSSNHSVMNVRGQLVDENGSPVGGTVQYLSTSPALISDLSTIGTADGGFVMAWNYGNGVFFRRYDQNMQSVGPFQSSPVEDTTAIRYQPRVAALDGGGFVMTWEHRTYDSSDVEVRARVFGADGQPTTDELTIAAGASVGFTSPNVVELENGDLAFVWNGQSYSSDEMSVWTSTWTSNGIQAFGPTKMVTLQGEDEVRHEAELVALNGSRYAVSWMEWANAGLATGYISIVDVEEQTVDEPLVVTPVDVRLNGLDIAENGAGGLIINWLSTTEPYGSMVRRVVVSENGIIDGGDSSDVIFLGSTHFMARGGAGDDTLFGGTGNDTLIGGEGADQLVGGAGDDVLTGDTGADQFSGGDGDDVLIAGLDDVSADGGAGYDVLRMRSVGGTVTAVANVIGSTEISNIERVEFSTGSVGDTSDSVDADAVDLIVDLSHGYSRAALLQAREDLGAKVLYGDGGAIQFWDIEGDAAAGLDLFAELETAGFAELDGQLSVDFQFESDILSSDQLSEELSGQEFETSATAPNDPSIGSLYGLNKIGAYDAWDRQTGSEDVVVAVIDSGIDIDHEDLRDNLWVNEGEIWGDGIDNDGNGYIDDYNGYDFVNNRGIGPGYARDDDNGHGTHVAGTIAAQGNNGVGISGVAWNASLMAVKVLDQNGDGTIADIVEGIRYATMMEARVSNNSYGGYGYRGSYSSISSAINEARTAGSIFVAAAGNDSFDNDTYNNYSYSYFSHYPSSFTQSNVVAVASTTSSDSLSSFSNYGRYSVDLGAPGSSIYSTYTGGGYRSLSGTSMATPHVTGAIALLLSEDPSMTYSQAIDAILDNVDRVSSLNGRSTSGGRLNVAAALGTVSGDDTPPILSVRDLMMSDDITTLGLGFTATDNSGDPVTMSVSGLDYGGISFNVYSQSFLYSAAAGAYVDNFTVTARDSAGNATSQNMRVTRVTDTDGVTLTGTASDEAMFGGSNSDTLTGGAGDDYLAGGSGDDYLMGGAGDDTIYGGDGIDTVSFADATAGVQASLAGNSGGGDAFYQVEILEGSAFNDTLAGSNGDDVLIGGAGDDELSGGAGADTLVGGEGLDLADYSSDSAGITVSLLDGTKTGAAAGDVYSGIEGVIGGSGADLLIGDDAANQLFGESGNDTILGGDGADTLFGMDGDDTIVGGRGADSLYGGDGADLIFAGDGDSVNGGAGVDTLDLGYLSGDVSVDFDNGVVSGAEIGTITFQNIETVAYSVAQDGTITATAAADFLVQTNGNLVDYSGSDAAITLDMGQGSASGGHAEGDVFQDVTHVRGSNFDDRFAGSDRDDTIHGGAGTDTLTLTGDFSEYALTVDNGVLVIDDLVAGRDGTDRVSGVESLEFADRTVGSGNGVLLLPANGAADENAGAGLTVGQVTMFALGAETFALTLQDDFGGLFAIDAATGEITTRSDLDFESAASYELTVLASGDQGSSETTTVTVSVNDVNEAPEDLALTSFSVAENAAVGAALATLSVNDPDANDSHSFVLLDDADGLFSIDAETGVIRVAAGLDFETAPAHVLTVRGTDTGGLSNEWQVSIAVTDANDAPDTPTVSLVPSIGEHATIGAVVGTASATDQDVGDSVSYSLVDDHGGAFAIDADSGVITVAGSLDYETDAAPVLQIRATDSGGLSSVGSSTLTVTDENDAPISGADQFSGFEETDVSISVADLLANDSDQDGDDFSLTNVENPTGGTVSLNDGQIVFTPDEEFTGLATFDYVLQDSHGATSTITVDIDISAQTIVAEGSAGSDDMRGGSAHDTLSGGDGSDILMGRKGDDVLIGGAGDDTYVYRIGDGADILDETGVPGGGGSDTLRFGSGIAAGQMEAHIEGRDLVLRFIDDGDLQLAASSDVLRLRNWLDSDARIEGFTFDDQPGVTLSASDMLSRFGGSGDEDFTWTEAAVSLFGRGGADRLVTGDNDDTLSGGTGNDVLIAGGGNDRLDGGGASNLVSWSEHYGRDAYYKDDVVIADGEVDSPVEGAQVTRLVPGTGPGMHRLIRAVEVVEAGIHTVSVYAMADELDGLRLEMASGWDGAAFAHYGTAAFDIEGGSVSGTNRDVLGAEVEDIGGGWYRVSAQMEFVTGTSYVNLNVRNAGADVFSRESEGGGLYLSGLQLERGETAGEYVSTRAVATLEPDGDDHLEGGGGNDSLSGGAGNDVLIGGSAENQMTWSGDFDHRAYLKDGTVVTEAEIDGPLTGVDGYRLSATNVDGFHRMSREVRVDESGIHTASLYVRTDDLDHLRFELASGWDGANFAHYGTVVFDLTEGRAESRSTAIRGAVVESVGNGWSRVSAQMAFDPGLSYFNVYLHDGNYYGFSNGEGRGLYIAGAQLESGNSVGAYLATSDSAILGGEDGSDYLVGGDGDDRVFGGAGADTIVGGSGRGNDVYSGGSGQDTIIYSSAEARIDVDLDEGYGRGADIDFDTLSGIENVVGGAGDDRLSGTEDANIIEGAGGDDLIVGGAGNDILIGDGTQNQITWSEDFTNAAYHKDGIGLETASGDALGFGMSATRLVGSAGNAMHRMNRAVTVATSGLHTVSAYVRADQLAHLRFELASGLNNGVFDHYGSVVFDAATGRVHHSHGALHSASVTDVGEGWYRVEATMPFAAGTSYVNTYLHDGTSHVFAGDGTSGLYFTGLQLEAGAAASSYHVTQGSRNAVDGAGDDRILAGAGDDAIFGGAGIDTLDYRDDAAGVTVDLVNGTATGSAAGSDRFSGIENAVGGTGNDVITGTAAINRLIGGGGGDRLVAGTEGEASSAARRENLMTWSAAFSRGNYLKDGTRAVAVASDSPVSGASVSRLTANAGTGFHRMNRNISVAEAGTYTTSIYAKAESLAGLRFEMASGWNGSGFDHYGTADFDLAGGRVLGSAHGIANATIENVGGGWYRVTATMSHAAGTSHLNVYMMNQGTHFFAGSGAESLLISGAQFESGTAAGTYVETTTGPVRQAAAGDVLIGDGQENLANWSDAFDNAAYYKDGVSVVANVADGPEAGMYADRVLENDATANHRIGRAVNVTEAGIYVASVYARAEDIDHLRFELASGWDGASFAHYGTAVYDLSEGSVDGTTHALLGADIEDVGDGWYRVSARMEMAVGQSYVNMYLHNGATHFYDGDATGSVLLSGMQVERGGIASDYTGTTRSGVYHAGGADVLVAGAGDDILSGGTGDDRYEIGRDGGDNTIYDAGGTEDSLVFGDTVNHDQLWFERSGDDLRVSIIGNSGSATISDWFASDAAQVENIVAGDGMELSSANVLQLVQAMAAETRPGDSDLTLPQETEDNLQSVLAASWSSAG
ncbi:cadherin domain-containing protein [Pacificispira sp.]|uniref:cadherin domain-containing protein n=1 Tax=Pacificispira sp. TaxID=2888761 RepID=UPI003BAB15EF